MPKSMFGPTQSSYANLANLLGNFKNTLESQNPHTIEELNAYIVSINANILKLQKEKNKIGA